MQIYINLYIGERPITLLGGKMVEIKKVSKEELNEEPSLVEEDEIKERRKGKEFIAS